jgi:hypothetical protein
MNSINNIIKLLSINDNIEIIGSNSNKEAKYTTDYDLQEIITIKEVNDYNIFIQKFQNIFKIVKKSNYMAITDMKAGKFNTLPVRWSYNDVINKYQDIDTKHIELFDVLQESSKTNTVKIDIIAFINNEYVEFSCNYYFSKSNVQINDILLSLMIDVQKYYHEQRFMKMLKRLMSYRLVRKQKVNDLKDFFNSDIGNYYKLYHHIDVFIFIINKYNDEYDKITTGISKKDFNKYNQIVYKYLVKQLQSNNIKVNKNNINIQELELIKSKLNIIINDIVIKFINK